MNITKIAKEKIEHFIAIDEGSVFRIKVNTGGCNGFKYEFLVDNPDPSDETIDSGCGLIVIDKISYSFIKNATLDYLNEIGQAGFVVLNPDAKSQCGCGISFDF